MSPPGSPILINGSHGEGGGALVRTSLAMSALTQQPVRIDNIRGATKHPGLDVEDLVLLRALATSCRAETIGAEVGSLSVSFLPTRRAQSLNGSLDLPEDGNTHRVASAPVVLNALLPVLARAGAYSQVSLSGETYGHRAIGFDYFQNVTIAVLRKWGLYAFPDQELAGFGRASRGRIAIDVEPSALEGQDWSTRGKLVGCRALVTTAELPPSVGERGVSHLAKLAENARVSLEVEAGAVEAHSAGAYVTVWAQFERAFGGATAMGQRGLRIETLVQGAFEEFLDWMATDATVDPFLADQLLVTACLAEGDSTFQVNRLTERFLTIVWVVKQFLPIRLTILGSEGGCGTIAIKR